MAPQTAIQEAIGTAQQTFADTMKAKREELSEGGQCEPFTIANFNPTDLRLQGQLQKFSVPSPYDERLPKDVLRITLPYDGKDRVAHCLTIREPDFYGRNKGATWHAGGGPGDAIVDRDVMYYLPVAIAYNFLEHFSPIFVTGKDGQAAPPPKDGRRFYGVLAFRGDIHTLERALGEEDRAKRVIHVPLAKVRQVGKHTLQRSFTSVATSLDDYLARMFTGQLRFADGVISRAQQKFNGTDEDRKDISASDRIWYRWAIQMGYAKAPKPGEKTWLNELLSLNTGVDSEGESLAGRRKCQACRTVEPEPDTPFCPKCNAPINTFTTFMAGFPVAESWLMALRGEEREIALEEVRIRQQGFGVAETTETKTPAKPANRGPYKGAGKKEPVPNPAATTMPGEDE